MSEQRRGEPPDLRDPRFAVPTHADLSPWGLPSWAPVAAVIAGGDAMWESMVPPEVGELIKKCGFFDYHRRG